MRFAIDADTGNQISGWIVLDNPNETPTIRIIVPGRKHIDMLANIHRRDLVDGGWHATGMVGFYIDSSIVPGLETENEIELRERDSKLLFYKRYSIHSHIDKKLLLLDSSLFPQRKLYNTINPHFSLPFNFITHLSYETFFSIVSMPHGKSMFIAGRPFYMRYAGDFQLYQYVVAALLRDPFEQFAENLLFLNLVARSQNPELFAPLVAGMTSLLPFALEFPFDNDKEMAKAIRKLSEEQQDLLRDPTTRMLACNPGERANRNHVSVALGNLATMNAVGTRARFAEFRTMLADALGADVIHDAVPEVWTSAPALTEKLARLDIVKDLLENDLALFSFAEEAVETGLSNAERKAAT